MGGTGDRQASGSRPGEYRFLNWATPLSHFDPERSSFL